VFIVGMSVFKGVEVARRVEDFREPLVRHPADIPVLTAGLYPAPPSKPEPVKEPEVEKDKPETPTQPQHVPPVKNPDRPLVAKVVSPIEQLPPKVVEVAGVEVTVNVRPFGYLSVDQKERSADALTAHRFKLGVGHHKLTVTCDACESTGKTVDVDVMAGKENSFNVAAPLKASNVMFTGFPDDAVVRIGTEQRTAKESLSVPFRITMPPEGSPTMLHQVKYEVLQNGEVIASGTKTVEPGKSLAISKGAN
jgi:serine/threonine-protein kinase